MSRAVPSRSEAATQVVSQERIFDPARSTHGAPRREQRKENMCEQGRRHEGRDEDCEKRGIHSEPDLSLR
jgi:hypothetical protein